MKTNVIFKLLAATI